MAPKTHVPEPLPADPTALVEQLDSDTICRRIDQLDADRKALVVLLRAARARERVLARPREVCDAQ